MDKNGAAGKHINVDKQSTGGGSGRLDDQPGLGLDNRADSCLLCPYFDGSAYSIPCWKVIDDEDLSAWRLPILRRSSSPQEEPLFQCITGGRELRESGLRATAYSYADGSGTYTLYHGSPAMDYFGCGGRGRIIHGRKGEVRLLKRIPISKFIESAEAKQIAIWEKFQKTYDAYREIVCHMKWTDFLSRTCKNPVYLNVGCVSVLVYMRKLVAINMAKHITDDEVHRILSKLAASGKPEYGPVLLGKVSIPDGCQLQFNNVKLDSEGTFGTSGSVVYPDVVMSEW
jgi:hypothetical protein